MASSNSFLSLTKTSINPQSISTPFLYFKHKPQKGKLLSTFSRSVLLIQYNDFISKHDKNKQMKNSLNSCISVRNHGPLLSYSQRTKKLNNSLTNSCLLKSESTMNGNSFISSNKSYIYPNKINSSNNSFNNSYSYLNLSSGDFIKNKYLIQKIKKSKRASKSLLRKSILSKEELKQKLNINENDNNVCHVSNQTHKAFCYPISQRKGIKSKININKYGKSNEINSFRINNENDVIGDNKPFDRFSKFKKESVFKFKETNNVVMKLNRLLINNQDYLKDYIANLRFRKYIVQSKQEKKVE